MSRKTPGRAAAALDDPDRAALLDDVQPSGLAPSRAAIADRRVEPARDDRDRGACRPTAACSVGARAAAAAGRRQERDERGTEGRARASHRTLAEGVGFAPPMRIFVIGAGQVGSTIVEALHDEHDLTVIDLDPRRLDAARLPVRRLDAARATAPAAARSRRRASRRPTSLIACTSRDEANLVAACSPNELAPQTRR